MHFSLLDSITFSRRCANQDSPPNMSCCNRKANAPSTTSVYGGDDAEFAAVGFTGWSHQHPCPSLLLHLWSLSLPDPLPLAAIAIVVHRASQRDTPFLLSSSVSRGDCQ